MDLPSDPREFYRMSAQVELPEIDPATPPALERLGQPPYPKSKFPFLGFLASVYDHVASHARMRTNAQAADATQIQAEV